MRLTGGTSKLAYHARILRLAQRTRNHRGFTEKYAFIDLINGWRNAVFLQFSFAFLRNPIGGPSGGKDRFNSEILNVILRQGGSDIGLNGLHCGTTAVGRGNNDEPVLALIGHGTQNSQIQNV